MSELKNFTTEQLEAELHRRKQTGANAYMIEQCGGDYEAGEPSGHCDGMGMWICLTCKWRNPEGIREEEESRLLKHHNPPKNVMRIKARVKETGQTVMVDDMPVDGQYNMWHYDKDRHHYHDDELEFLQPRLQERK